MTSSTRWMRRVKQENENDALQKERKEKFIIYDCDTCNENKGPTHYKRIIVRL